MEASENITLHRTCGDTDSIVLVLRTLTSNGLLPVPDAAAVEMHVKEGNTVHDVPGVAKGNGSGTFLFNPASILSLVGSFHYEIEVQEGPDLVYTIARGMLVCAAELA